MVYEHRLIYTEREPADRARHWVEESITFIENVYVDEGVESIECYPDDDPADEGDSLWICTFFTEGKIEELTLRTLLAETYPGTYDINIDVNAV